MKNYESIFVPAIGLEGRNEVDVIGIQDGHNGGGGGGNSRHPLSLLGGQG